MTAAGIDRLLAALLAIAGGSGLLTLAAGADDSAWLFISHGIAGACLTAAIGVKLWRSVPRALAACRWGRLSLAGLVTLMALLSAFAALGQAAVGGLVTIGPWTLISWHVCAALTLVPILLVHLLPRRWQLFRRQRRAPGGATARPSVSRRALLQLGAIGVAGVGLWSVAQISGRIAGGARRFTGSQAVVVAAPPPTTFFGEPTPQIDLAGWRLRVDGLVARRLALSAADLASLPATTRRAVLDCTSGWSADCEWTGVSLGTLLNAAEPAPGATTVDVRSVTGWSTLLSLSDAGRALLATDVGGSPLTSGNGAPARLVVPDRRGLEWIKWVDRIEIR